MTSFNFGGRDIERSVIRVLFAFVLAHHLPVTLAYDSLPYPNGLARVLDLTAILEPRVYTACRYTFYGALAFYVLRLGWWLVLPYMTLLSIIVGSTLNSQGGIGHYLQIVSLVLLAQTAAYYYHWVRSRGPTEDFDAEGRLISWSQQAIAATYLASGLTKLITTSGRWIFQSPLVAIQIIKTNEQDFYDKLSSASSANAWTTAEWMAHHPWIVGALMTAGLLLELAAPVLLLGRRAAAAYGLTLLLFHHTIHRMMKLHFVYNEYLLWIYVINIPFWICAAFLTVRRYWLARRC